jgi:hypothetical protein
MAEKQIALRAYDLWERRGRPIGSPEVDWFRAVKDYKREQMLHGCS